MDGGGHGVVMFNKLCHSFIADFSLLEQDHLFLAWLGLEWALERPGPNLWSCVGLPPHDQVSQGTHSDGSQK